MGTDYFVYFPPSFANEGGVTRPPRPQPIRIIHVKSICYGKHTKNQHPL
uniref:Uncharacterized protein n=1 Tax=Candidatus Kentrum sp. FM TaxID=2126340 RepID=A0A450S1D0_9GAMM|nr:MAG: hypothetical protein BECKFM1743C_GA0114222_100257 [Candidatus Kentron sp. FM]VFJ49065.1 MAG: hypothetical protein BECKFM1743A_GA0114220_100666 [Candidatus Kentron sp. FM]VFK06766.1 MAG: hypothetical protein BECKFM1743B_GA0114221_100247 [Candidatus Kentron sp. FM]